MKMLGIFALFVALLFAASCEPGSGKVTVRVIEHKAGAGGKSYALVCQILQPTNLAGRYGFAATQRSDLVSNVDGGVYEVPLNLIMHGKLDYYKPVDYEPPSPTPGSVDFFDSAKCIK